MPKPKQAKAGQDELTSCPQLIQPLSGATTHATPEPQQIWAELDSPVGVQQASRRRDAHLPSSGIFAA